MIGLRVGSSQGKNECQMHCSKKIRDPTAHAQRGGRVTRNIHDGGGVRRIGLKICTFDILGVKRSVMYFLGV